MLRWSLRLCFLILFQLLCVTYSKNSSLTFVIDDTTSMGEDIMQVKHAAKNIMDVLMGTEASEIEDVVLVTFNDPVKYNKLRIKTSIKQELLNALYEIEVNNIGNGDCPEYSLSGIKLALQESRHGSYLFVFTDSTAKDADKLNEVKQLCEKKQSQVFFIISNNICGHPYHNPDNFESYYKIAQACSGLVITVDKNEVGSVMQLITPLLRDRKSILVRIDLPPSKKMISVPFKVDDKTDYAIISTAALNVMLDVKSKDNNIMKTEKLVWLQSGKVVKFYPTKPGTYYAWVKGNTKVSVQIYARTDFTFDHGFSNFVPKSLDDASKLPIADREHYLSISVTDPEHAVEIKSAEILNMTGEVVMSLPLKKINYNDFYITNNPFVSPKFMFKIRVTGRDKKTGSRIERLSKTAIEPQAPPPPASKPLQTTILEGPTVNVDYDGEIILTCEVFGYPLSEIVWTSRVGNVLSSRSYEVELPYKYISYLTLKHIKHPGSYYCRATNNEDRHESMVTVKPQSPFRINSLPTEATQVKYGEEKRLTCNISSSYPFNITWSTPLKPEDFTLSADKKVLTIKEMSITAQGRYICKATLQGDPEQNVSTAIDVKISDLALPRLATSGNIKILHGENIHIRCKITRGVPPPSMSWQFKMHNDNVFRDMHVTGEEITINNASLPNAGQYRCIANNSQGFATETIELVVQKEPEVSINSNTSITATYGSTTVFQCKTTAYPRPIILWRDNKGHELSAMIKNKNYEVISTLIVKNIRTSVTAYSCYAKNYLNESVSTVQVTVLPPISFPKNVPETVNVTYGSLGKVHCDAKSSYPVTIKWFYQKNAQSEDTEIHTSDKYTISSNGTILHINPTNLDTIGKYTCEASLVNNRNEKAKFTTVVQLSDLSVPVLQDAMSTTITVLNKKSVKIMCKIASGTPPPVISWQVMKTGDIKFKDLRNSDEELIIDGATLGDAGQYKCIANNTQGHANKTIELVVQKAPEVTIDGASILKVPYGSTTELKCRTLAYPPPQIVWRDSNGHELLSKTKSDKYEVISRIIVQSNKTSVTTYSCYAKNDLDESVSTVQVTVLPPISIPKNVPETVNVTYGSLGKVHCDAKSSYPVTIKWFYQKNAQSEDTEIHTSDKYTISSTGTILHINPTNLDTIGKYTCEASLVNNRNEKAKFTTVVQLSDLSVPVLQDAMSTTITVPNKKSVKIMCKIASGTPPPVISWQVMKTGDIKFKDLRGSDEELIIDSATLGDAGQYKCIAKNTQGHANKTIELVVKKAPEVTIDGASILTVPYGSTTELKCKALAYPPPQIVWRDSNGHELISKEISNKYEVIRRLIVQNTKTSDTSYFCNANNDLGKSEASVQVTVLSPIVFPTNLSETVSVRYKASVTIHCNANSSHPIKIKWFYQKNGQPQKTEVQASDKYLISLDARWLHIKQLGLDLVGKYTCVASLVSDRDENKSFTTNVEINNLKAPEIIYTNNTVTVMDGQKLIITCAATGIPEPVVTWRFEAKNSDIFDTKQVLGQNYINSHISYAWAGTYECTAANEIGSQNRTIEVIVHGQPNITNDDSVYIGVTGDLVLKIPCEVTGVPEPVITWKHGNKVATSDKKITVTKNAIIIKNPTENDSSIFICEAKNVYGHVTKHFKASISDFIVDRNEELNSNINLKPRDSKDIKCDLPHADPQSIRWFINDEKTNVLGTYYFIRNATFENDGNYTCRLNTDQGSESLNYVVDIGYKPSFKMVLDPFYVWNGNKEDTLDCDVHAKPNANVEWFFNGKRLNYDGVDLTVSGWGTYSCNVSNVHGSIQHTYNVTSDGCIINRTATGIQNTPLLIGDEPSSWPQFDTVLEFFTVSQNEIITLECATLDQPQNTFKTFPNANKIDAECLNEDKFIVDEKIYKFEDLQCKEYVKPSQVFTKKSCMNNGETIEIGFKLHSGFLKVYEVCYSYTDHKILFTKVIMSNVNMGNEIESTFELNEGTKMGKIIHGEIKKCQYNQRWLVNPMDVTFGPAQTATLLDEYNAVLAYEPCDGISRISWSDVEKAVQSLHLISNTLTVWTGASNYNSLGIPRYLWKVVKIKDYAFDSIVYLNAPNDDIDVACTSKGSRSVIKNNKYTYSCNINDFMKAFNVSKSDFGITL